MTDDQLGGRASPEPADAVYSVSCCIHRDSLRTQTLLGVRRSTAVSRRHPGVLSTPTMRVPLSVFAGQTDVRPDSGITLLPETPRTPIGAENSLQYPASFLIEGLLARKLGVGDALAQGSVSGWTQLRAVSVDDVHDPLGTERVERTLMLTYAVHLEKGAEEFPPSTASYSQIIWASTDLISRALAARDALLIDDTLNPFEVCIDGLCVRSAAFIASQDSVQA
jgi:hypothetical protein